jgi:hypothetical protein
MDDIGNKASTRPLWSTAQYSQQAVIAVGSHYHVLPDHHTQGLSDFVPYALKATAILFLAC